MSELLSAAAAALGLPEPLVQRSAAARATDTGATVDEVLSAWAGGGDIPASAPVTAPPPETTASDEPVTHEAAPDTSVVPQPASIAQPAASSPTPAVRAPVPEVVSPREAARLPEVITVPTAGIRERTSSTIPRWLTGLLLFVPLFALFALGGLATGACGDSTELQTDVVTGEIVNCDGSEFTGSGGAGGVPNFMAEGRALFAANCASCHGPAGQGLGAFPSMQGVTTTFSACTDHIEWVTLGADGFREQGRLFYGDTRKPVGMMPSFAATLSEEQIAAVVAFERIGFGGADLDTEAVNCGLVEESPEDDDANGEDGEAGAFGSDPSASS